MTLPALSRLASGQLSLDPKLTAGDRLSRPPDLLGCWSKIEQELELSEGVEADVVEEANRRRVPRSGALTGSGAIQFVAEVAENPSVAAAVGATVGATVTNLLHRPKDPPPPPDPPHGGLWVPPSADE